MTGIDLKKKRVIILGDKALAALQKAVTGELQVEVLGGAFFTPILVGAVFNIPVVAATDIFPAVLTPTNSPVIFRVYFCFNAAGVVSVRRTRAGVTVGENLNGGGNISANAAYMFDIFVRVGDTINFRHSAGGTCLVLMVMEVSGGA